VIDLSTRQERWVAKATDESLKSVAISSDDKLLATGAGFSDSIIRLWDMASGKEIRRLEGHHAWVSALIFWPDGKTLASASADQTIRIWDTTNGQLLRTLRGHALEVWSLALSPDNRTLISGGKDGSVLLWDTGLPAANRGYVRLPKRIEAWRLLADSKSVLTLDREGQIERWHGDAFQAKTGIMDIGVSSNALFAHDVPFAAIGSANASVKVWDWERRISICEFKTTGRNAYPMRFLGGGKKLIVFVETSSEWILQEWDLASARQTRSWPAVESALSFSPDERACLALAWDGRHSLIDLITGRVSTPKLDFLQTFGVTFSPDGKLIAASNTFGLVRIWDAATFREVATVGGFLMAAKSVVFSPDGSRLAAGGGGGFEAIKLWDVESREELLTLSGRGSNLFDIAFSPDGSVLGVSGDGNLNLWRAPSWAEIEKAEAAAAKP
jgi:WD40 repeat protein